jgi:hypothetical protein
LEQEVLMGFARNTPNLPLGAAQKTAPPCKDCTERVLRCHSTCEKYKEWNKANLERYKEFYDHYKGERVAEQFEADSKRRTLKRQHRWNGR